MTARLLTVMGSGETTPTMVNVHRAAFQRLRAEGAPVAAVMLETPFGFQENATELSEKIAQYFHDSVDAAVDFAGLPRTDGASTLEREQAYSRIEQARFVFAGPGSPSFALRQWQDTPVAALLSSKLRSGGAVTFASAAALTLGVVTVPVYEIYKAGVDPYWLPGLNILSVLGISAAVVPHYNNAEGGSHDTRFSYLGERRLAMLEEQLPEGAFVLGIDEHTAVVFDLDADLATVDGRGVFTVRCRGTSTEFASGDTVELDFLRAAGSQPASKGAGATPAQLPQALADASAAPGVEGLSAAFDQAVAARDAAAAVTAVLELQSVVTDDAAADGGPERRAAAVAALRSSIVRLGAAATSGLADQRSVLGPVVDVALAARAEFRAMQRYDMSDQIRDSLAAAGIVVRDTRDEQAWDVVGPDQA
jgi:hypothetical protein